MHITRTTVAIGSLATAFVAGLASPASPAFADPAVKPPAVTDIVGVGSVTTQGVFGQLQTDYNTGKTSGRLASWDGFVPTEKPFTQIVEKAGCTPVDRPFGSNGGIADIQIGNRPNSGTAYCVDFARSSRAPQARDSGYGFVRFALNAVTWSKTSTTSSPSNLPASLSIKELKAIYSCDASVLGTGATGPVKENQVGGTGTANILPILPQPSSETRSFFLSAIGVTTPGSCILPTTPEEDQGKSLATQFTAAQLKDAVFPYSIAAYLAQSQNGKGTGNQGTQVLGSVEDGIGAVIAPTAGSTGALTLNPRLGTVGLTRFVYNVVRGTTIPTYLSGLFGTSGYLCTNTTAQNDIKAYGFLTIGTQCGTVQTA